MTKYGLVRTYYLLSALMPLEAMIAPVVVLFYINYIGLNFLQYSVFIAILLILNMSLEVPMGFISDKTGRRLALVFGNFIYLISLTSLLFADSFNFVIIAGLFLSIGQSLSSGNLNSIAYEIFDEKNKGSNFSHIEPPLVCRRL